MGAGHGEASPWLTTCTLRNRATGAEGLHYLGSADRGHTWSASCRIGSVDARRPDIATTDASTVLVAWDQFETSTPDMPAHTAICAIESRDGGRHCGKPARLSDTSYPRGVAIADGFVILWTQTSAGRNVLKMTPRHFSR
jgi:hypothetical protein